MLSRSVGQIPEADRAEIRIAARRAFFRSYRDALSLRLTRAELAASCSTLLVAGERETGVRPSNAALVALMPHATARYVRRTGHGRLGLKAALHQEMVGAWLAGRDLPDDLEPETAVWSRATVGRAMGRPG